MWQCATWQPHLVLVLGGQRPLAKCSDMLPIFHSDLTCFGCMSLFLSLQKPCCKTSHTECLVVVPQTAFMLWGLGGSMLACFAAIYNTFASDHAFSRDESGPWLTFHSKTQYF